MPETGQGLGVGCEIGYEVTRKWILTIEAHLRTEFNDATSSFMKLPESFCGIFRPNRALSTWLNYYKLEGDSDLGPHFEVLDSSRHAVGILVTAPGQEEKTIMTWQEFGA